MKACVLANHLPTQTLVYTLARSQRSCLNESASPRRSILSRLGRFLLQLGMSRSRRVFPAVLFSASNQGDLAWVFRGWRRSEILFPVGATPLAVLFSCGGYISRKQRDANF